MKSRLMSIVAGVILGTAFVACVFVAGSIKSVEFNSNKVVFDGKEIDITESPMLSVVNEGETNINNYMPLRTVLEAMGYIVSWDSNIRTIYINKAYTEKMLYGWWIAESGGITVQYHFLEDNTFYCTIETEEYPLAYVSDMYKLKGNTILVQGYDSAIDNSYILPISFSEDGKSWRMLPTEKFVFVPDPDQSWDESVKRITERPSEFSESSYLDIADILIGGWSDNDEKMGSTKFLFRNDGTLVMGTFNPSYGGDSVEEYNYTIVGDFLIIEYDSNGEMQYESFEIFFMPDGKSFGLAGTVSEPPWFTSDPDISWAEK